MDLGIKGKKAIVCAAPDILINNAGAFLCGQKASYITGQNLLLDGGGFPGTL